jgi:hypothetical protein
MNEDIEQIMADPKATREELRSCVESLLVIDGIPVAHLRDYIVHLKAENELAGQSIKYMSVKVESLQAELAEHDKNSVMRVVQVANLEAELAAYKNKLRSVGGYCLSEDDCIAEGIDFPSYERAINDVIKAMEFKP